MKNKRFIFITVILIALTFIGTKAFGIFSDSDMYVKMRVFTEILTDIKDYYVDEKNPSKLLDNAINGMLKDLDPHTVLLPPERSQDMDERFQGFGGIGIMFRVIDEKITILDVFRDGPCDKLGLKRGDRIVEIEGESAIGIDQNDVPPKLKGIPGTGVNVKVERPGWDEPRPFTIIRERIPPESVSHIFMLDDEIGYIEMEKFSSTTVEELNRALKILKEKNMKKLVLDLRRNPGGYLPISVGVSDKFLPGGKKIVYTKGRTRDSMKEFHSTDKTTHPLLPMIILISGSSASASEIVSGALQDWDRALIVGERSFGKALVQTPFKLRDDSRLLLTTARYYTPNGRLIQKKYEGKTLEQYYRDSHNPDLPENEDNAKNDSLKFKTFGGRTVFGGGGISPDITIKYTLPIDTISYKLLRKLDDIAPPFGAGFMFNDEYAEEHPELRKNKKNFIKYFEVNDEIIEEYKSSLRRRGVEFNEEDFNTHINDIRFLLKVELAHQLWDKNEGWQVYLQRDAQLKQAVSYFNEAEQLLVNNYSNYYGAINK